MRKLFVFLALAAFAFSMSANARNSWNTPEESVAAWEKVQPEGLPFWYAEKENKLPLGPGEIVMGAPQDMFIYLRIPKILDYPDENGIVDGWGLVPIEAGRRVIYDQTSGKMLRLEECGNEIRGGFPFPPLPTLKGEKGEPGKPGPPGESIEGPQGPPGSPGQDAPYSPPLFTWGVGIGWGSCSGWGYQPCYGCGSNGGNTIVVKNYNYNTATTTTPRGAPPSGVTGPVKGIPPSGVTGPVKPGGTPGAGVTGPVEPRQVARFNPRQSQGSRTEPRQSVQGRTEPRGIRPPQQQRVPQQYRAPQQQRAPQYRAPQKAAPPQMRQSAPKNYTAPKSGASGGRRHR